MTAYQPDQWHDLFTAVAGASAALAGLIFVAVSINLARILELRTLPTRAAETLSIMVGVLVLSVLALVPGQGRLAFGAEALVLGLAGGAFLMIRRLRLQREKDDPIYWTVVPAGIIVVGTVPMIAGGISLLAGVGGGLYWLAAEIVLAIVGVVVNAWILLVEIMR
jgi:hypothetical protein